MALDLRHALRFIPGQKVGYVLNPKAGSSTAMASLWALRDKASGVETYTGEPHAPENPFLKPHQLQGHLSELANAEWFSIARNPFSRILSAYLDKVAARRDPGVWHLFSTRYQVNEPPKFIDFLHMLAADDPASLDQHFRPQWLNMHIGRMPIQMVGRLEDMDDVSGWLAERGVPMKTTNRHATKANDSAEMFGSDERRIALTLYGKDLDLFGYPENPRDRVSCGGIRSSEGAPLASTLQPPSPSESNFSQVNEMIPLSPTGERFIPEFFSGVIALEHLHRYHLALELADNKDVLDIACGEGYGSDMLMRRARSVVGVDIDPHTVTHAQQKYGQAGLSFLHGSATKIPLDDNSVDLVVSFETIEHLNEHDDMLAEMARVLRPSGVLFISSPNKAVYSDKTNHKNDFHVKELYTEELVECVNKQFRYISTYGQKATSASVVSSSTSAPFLIYSDNNVHTTLPENRYDILLASNEPLVTLPNSIFEVTDSPLQPELSGLAIEALRSELAEANMRMGLLEEKLRTNEEKVRASEDAIFTLNQAHQNLLACAKQMARDANVIVQDKWWKRTKFIRKLSNSVRRQRGRAKKQWREHFEITE